MIIKDYRTLVHTILFSADHILSEKEHSKGNFMSLSLRMEQYLQMARSMKGLMELDTSGQEKNYSDYLEWQRMYEKASKCHLRLEIMINNGVCDIPPRRDDNFLINALCKCLEEILADEDMNCKSDLDKFKDIWRQFVKTYSDSEELFLKWAKIALSIFEEFFEYFDDTNEGSKEAIVGAYYDYLEEHEEDIRDELCNFVYEKKILSSYSEEPTAEHYGELLKELLEQAKYNVKTRIIAEKFSHSKAINIDKECFLCYINKECKADNDVMLFFSTFAQLAILQELTKEKIKIRRRPEKLMPLPEVVSLTINDDIQMNKMFREIIKRLSSMVGGSFRKKWSHVKRVLEDEELMSKTNDTEFGRVMHEICTDINAENCRTNAKNNPVTPTNADKGKKYYEWTVTKGKDECMAVAKEFAPLLALLRPKVSK